MNDLEIYTRMPHDEFESLKEEVGASISSELENARQSVGAEQFLLAAVQINNARVLLGELVRGAQLRGYEEVTGKGEQ